MDLTLLPPGFHFTPTAEELLQLYLLPRKIHGPDAVPGRFISDVHLYGDKEPWVLFPVSQEDCHLFYVFTELKKVARKDEKSKPKGKNNVRCAGSGFWWGRAVKPVNDSDGNLIGMDHYYTFEAKKSKNKKKKTKSTTGCNDDEDSSKKEEHGHWTMHEYSLVDACGNSLEGPVVCVVGCNTQINVKHCASPSKKRRFPAAPSDLGEIPSKQTCANSPPSVLEFPEPQEPCLGSAEEGDFTAEDIEQWLLQEDQLQTSTNSALLLPECVEAVAVTTTEEQCFTLEEMEQWLQEDQETITNSALVLPECEDAVTTEEQVLTAEEIEEWLQEYQETSTDKPTFPSDGGSSSNS